MVENRWRHDTYHAHGGEVADLDRGVIEPEENDGHVDEDAADDGDVVEGRTR